MADKPICSIHDCDKPAKTRGWCIMHYQRWLSHGDPLGGSPKNYDASHFYSNVVLTHDGDDCLIWPFARTARGYAQMWHDGRSRYVHRRLCEEIHGPAPTISHQVAHSCGRGDKGCVSKHHLSWKTPLENSFDKLEHGTILRGSQMWASKLNEDDVRKIIALKGTMRQIDIAEMFGVTRANISQIHLGKIWAWVRETESHQQSCDLPNRSVATK